MYLLLVTASFLWGVNVLVMKYMLAHISIYTLAAMRVGISFLCVYIVTKIKKEKLGVVDKKEAFKISVFSLTLNFIFTFWGMEYINGMNTAIMNALAPFVTIALSMILYHQAIKNSQKMALLLALIGFGISIQWNVAHINKGHVLLWVGMFNYCYANICLQKSKSADHYLAFTSLYLWFGFLELLCLSFIFTPSAFRQLPQVPLFSWLVFFFISGIGFAYIQLVYLYAIKKIGSIHTSFFLSLNPVFTYLGSIFFLQEKFSFDTAIAFFILIVALILVTIGKKEAA